MNSTNPSARVSQTRSFSTVFLIEMWERFGYYGMAALLVLFMIDKLHFTDSHATLTWGAFTALVYASPSIGGWIGDKILGARRTMIFGAAVLAAGYLMLAMPNEQLAYMYASLGVIVVGNGLFKANAANLVRRIYEGDDARIDSAFTIYYMAVNIGSTVSMLATPWIKDHWGWHTAFAVCCAGMLLSVLNYFVMFRTLAHIGSAPDAEPIRWKRVGAVALGGILLGTATMFVLQHKAIAVACVYTAGVAILAIFGYMLVKCERSERAGLVAALILTAQVILFFVFYVQMSTSLTLFALRNVDPRFSLFGVTLFTWSAAQFQALNPIWIMLLSPLLALLYTKLAKNGNDVPVAVKYAFGFAVVAAGFFVYACERPLRGQRPGVVVVHGGRLRPVFARRIAGQRARSRDDRALRAGAHERLHDGRVLRGDRRVAVSGQRGGEFRADAGGRSGSARIAADVHQVVYGPGLARGGGCAGRGAAVAADAQALARTSALQRRSA